MSAAVHPGAVPCAVGLVRVSVAELVKNASDLHDPNPVDAEHVRQQLLQNYPPASVAWVSDIPWIGPVEIPLDRIDWDDKDSWAASHQKKHVKRFAKRIHNGGEDVHPIVGVQVPGDDRVKVIDGHHRALAYQKEGKPAKAYVGFAPSNDSDSPWFQAHLYQKKQGADPANKAFDPRQLRDAHGRWSKKPGNESGSRRRSEGGDLRSRLGRCYELSGRYVMDHPESTLVHGSIQGMGNPRIGHAWAITKDGQVWEPATNQEYSPVVFNAVFNPHEDKRYPWSDALAKMTEHGTFGPWDEATKIEKRVSFNPLEMRDHHGRWSRSADDDANAPIHRAIDEAQSLFKPDSYSYRKLVSARSHIMAGDKEAALSDVDASVNALQRLHDTFSGREGASTAIVDMKLAKMKEFRNQLASFTVHAPAEHPIAGGKDHNLSPGQFMQVTDTVPAKDHAIKLRLNGVDPALQKITTARVKRFASRYPHAASLLTDVSSAMPGELPESTMARAVYSVDGTSSVRLNLKYFGDFHELQSALLDSVRSGFHPLDTLGSVIDHELGHVLDNSHFDGTNQSMPSNDDGWAFTDANARVSRYSAKNRAEAFAESFALWEAAQDDSSVSTSKLSVTMKQALGDLQTWDEIYGESHKAESLPFRSPFEPTCEGFVPDEAKDSAGHTNAKKYIIVPVGEVSLLQKHFNPLELRDAHGKWTGESAAKEVSQAYSDARVFGNAPQLVRDGRVHDAADEVDEKASQARDGKHARRLESLAIRLRAAPVADESYIHREEQEAGFTEPDPGTLVSAQSKSNDDLERDLGFRPPEKNYDFQWTHGIDPEKAEAARRELLDRAILGEYRPPPKLFPATMHAASLVQAQAALADLQAQWRKVSRNYIPEGARTTKKPKVAKADELAQKIHGGIWPLFGDYTLAGKLKVSVADLMKAGPEGYIHGWICVRPPCGDRYKQSRFDSGKGTVHHGENNGKLGKMRKNADGTYSMAYHDPDGDSPSTPGRKLTARYASRKDAAESVALYHNITLLNREAGIDNGYDSMMRREVGIAKEAFAAGNIPIAISHLDSAAGWERGNGNSDKLLSHIAELKKAIKDGPQPAPDAPLPENAVNLVGDIGGYVRVGKYGRELNNTVFHDNFGDRPVGKDVARAPGDAGYKIRFRNFDGLRETLEGQYATRQDASDAIVAYHNIGRMHASLQSLPGIRKDKISRALSDAKESLSDGNHEEAIRYLHIAQEAAEDQNSDTYASHIADTIQRLESANKPVFAPKLTADSYPGDTEPMRLANSVKIYDHSEGQLRNPALANASMRLQLLKQATFSPATVKNIKKIEITPKVSSKNALGVHLAESDATRLEIHPSVFDATAPDVLKRGVDSGWWVPVGPDDTLTDSVLSHEVGHAVAFKAFRALGYPASRDFWNKFTTIANAQPLKSGSVRHLMKAPKGTTPGVLPSDMNAWVRDNKETLAGDVSTYGASDVHELQAELWSEYTSNLSPRPLAKLYGDYVVNHMKNMGYE